MISDVLSDAIQEINEYLVNCPDAYQPKHPLTERINQLVDEMIAVRDELDKPPFFRREK